MTIDKDSIKITSEVEKDVESAEIDIRQANEEIIDSDSFSKKAEDSSCLTKSLEVSIHADGKPTLLDDSIDIVEFDDDGVSKRLEVTEHLHISSIQASMNEVKLNNTQTDEKNNSFMNEIVESGSKNKNVKNETDSNTDNPKTTNLLVINSENCEKQITKKDIVLNGQKLFLVNGGIAKDDLENGKNENFNIICLSNNFAMKPGKSLLSNNDVDKSGVKTLEKLFNGQKTLSLNPSQGAKFVPLIQNNMKNISTKISVNVSTPKPIAPKPAPIAVTVQPSKKVGQEILRSKLLETESANVNSMSEAVVRSKIVLRKDEDESPAVVKARSEFMRCRKQLIEAAIYPQLSPFKPPSGYVGPVFACEECDDTFTSMNSLKNHKNRRSVLFTYNCPLCKVTLEFFNRCTFLLHVRSHDANVKACYLTISTIPADKLNFKVLQREENDAVPPLVPRTRDRIVGRKESDEVNECGSNKPELKENSDKYKINRKTLIDRNQILKSFDFIKSLKKKKFSVQFQNKDKKKSDSSDSESSSEDEAIVQASDTAVGNLDTVVNGDKESQLKYFLTANSTDLKSAKRKNEEEVVESCKKAKLNEMPEASRTLSSNTESSKIPTPVIIKTKAVPGSSKEVEKSVEEIILTSSDEEEGEEEQSETECTEDKKFVVCRDCKEEVNNLNKHYRGENRPLKEYPCEQCKFFNPSACALAAHNRMHTKTQPYVCPDCGFYFSTSESFQTHVRQICYYDYKTIRFQCPECSLLKPSVPQFADHLKRCHTRDVFKCSLCITSSYSPKVVDAHMKRKHEGEPGTVLEGYRCMLCPNILVSKKSIDLHINKHVFNLQHLRYVYICKRCKKYASGKINKFIHHIKLCSDKKSDMVKAKNKSPANKAIVTKMAKKPVRKNSVTPKEDSPMEKDPLSVEDWEADKLKAEFVPKTKICIMCHSSNVDEKSKSLFCKACVSYVNAEDNSSDNLGGAAMKPDSGRPKRKFKCRICRQFMNKDWATITQHYEKDHHADFDVRKDGKKTFKEEPKKTDVNPVNIIKKRKLSSKEAIPKLKKPVEDFKYKCVKCNYACIDRDEFRNHIITHKMPNRNEFQCLECGDCFIVKASLLKHLVIVHKIHDLLKYSMSNEMMKTNDQTKTEIIPGENQCEVCLLKCDSKQSYDKHIRTHGMAFVAMQSRVKDDKSPRG